MQNPFGLGQGWWGEVRKLSQSRDNLFTMEGRAMMQRVWSAEEKLGIVWAGLRSLIIEQPRKPFFVV